MENNKRKYGSFIRAIIENQPVTANELSKITSTNKYYVGQRIHSLRNSGWFIISGLHGYTLRPKISDIVYDYTRRCKCNIGSAKTMKLEAKRLIDDDNVKMIYEIHNKMIASNDRLLKNDSNA